MGQGQSQQQQQQQGSNLTPEQLAALYEQKFQEAPRVNSDESNTNEQKLKQNIGIQQVEPEQQQIQQQQIEQTQQEQQMATQEQQAMNTIIQENLEQFTQFEQNSALIVQDDSQHQEVIENEVAMTPEQIEHIWISRAFEIITSNQTIMGTKVSFLVLNSDLTVDLLSDSLIMEVLSDKENFTTQQKLNWLLEALHRLIVPRNTDSTKYIELAEGSIKIHVYNQIMNSVQSYLTTLILYAESMDIQQTNENQHYLQDTKNTIASQVYEQIFDQNNFNFNSDVLTTYLEYLSINVSSDDRTQILDLMLKRELINCQKITLLNNTSQLRALELVVKIAEYPSLIEPLLLNSWAFTKIGRIRIGREIQDYTIIGRALSLSSFPQENQEWKSIFSQINHRQTESQLQVFRARINRAIDATAALFKKLLANQLTRPKTLSFLSHVIHLNLNRDKTFNQHLQNSCSTGGFIHNFVQVLLRLCQKFMESTDVITIKSQQIDVNLIGYLKQHPLLANIYGQTNLLNQELHQFQEPESFDAQPHLMTIMYLFTQRALHLQTTTIQHYIKLLEHISQLHQEGNPQYQEFLPQKYAYDLQLFDKISIRDTMSFLCFECSVALNLIKDYQPQYPYGLLPNIFLEDIHTFISVYNHAGELSQFHNEIMIISELISLMMCYKELINNPHIRVKGIELFHILVPNRQQQSRRKETALWRIFVESQIVSDTLIEGLINVFVEAERTGNANQYYEKFQFRYIFCQVLNYLFESHQAIYSKKLYQVVKKDKQLFLKFANVYLSDIIFLLDECLDKMKKMKIIEKEMDDGNMENQKAHHDHEKILKVYSLFLHEYYQNIQRFSQHESEAFLTDEIREKLVGNMNYTVKQLNGPDALDYKTRSMQAVKFEPKFIIGNVIELYINLSKDELFLLEIVNDERSFSLELFYNTINRLSKNNILSPDRIEEFARIVERLDKLKNSNSNLIKIQEGAPDEFIDQLLGHLMTDPVLLPHSKVFSLLNKVVVDRLTMKKHLLNSSQDPFDRSLLTEDMLIEQPELKQRIAEYIQSKSLLSDNSRKASDFKKLNMQQEFDITQLTDIPEEFKDALTGQIMTNPCLLPSSQKLVDKSSIQKLLKEQQVDPFDQTYLSEEMLLENNQLQKTIQDYIEKQRQDFDQQMK